MSMKDTLKPGTSLTRKLTVDRDRTISFMGEEGRVYSTPNLIRDIEHACRDLILAHADPGEDSVGMEVSLRHLAATLPGSTVEISVTVSAVDRRRIVFDVSANDEVEPISAGTHARFVVETAKTLERLKAKAAKRDAARAAG
jgi:fluoroacetyl-CoA thioesterase